MKLVSYWCAIQWFVIFKVNTPFIVFTNIFYISLAYPPLLFKNFYKIYLANVVILGRKFSGMDSIHSVVQSSPLLIFQKSFLLPVILYYE